MYKKLLITVATLFSLFSFAYTPSSAQALAPADEVACQIYMDSCKGKSGTDLASCQKGIKDANKNINYDVCISFNPGFTLPTLSGVLTFIIRLIFIAAGLLALVQLILGAFKYITSGGDEKKTQGAQSQIQAAVIGVILLVVVFAIVATLEQIVFAGKLGLGVTVPLTIPNLIN